MPASMTIKQSEHVFLAADAVRGRFPGTATIAASALSPVLYSGMACALVVSCVSVRALAAMAVTSVAVALVGGGFGAVVRRPRLSVLVAVVLAAGALASMLVFPPVRASLYAFCNAIIWRFDEVHGLFVPLIAPGDTVAGSIGFGTCLGVLTGVIWWGATRVRHSATSLILGVALSVFCLHNGMGAGSPAVVLGCAGWLTHCRYTQLTSAKTSWLALFLNLSIAACACALIVGVTLALTTPGGALQSAREATVEAFDDLRFGSRELPEGDMTQAAHMNNYSEAYLLVSASGAVGDDMLLRGYVGATYVGSSWQPLDHTALEGRWLGMNAWLASRGFSSGRQRSLYDDLKASTSRTATSKLNVDVDASSTDMRYSYVPVTLRTSDDLRRATDADGAQVNTFWGARSYSYSVDNVPASALYDDASWLSSINSSYVQNEKVYSAFAHDAYTKIAKRDAAAVKRLLFNSTTWDASADVTEYAVISRVRTMLDTLASYTETPQTPAAHREFVSWFLETAHEGNSAYFATVATLAFRSQGIPARYVEGYRASAAALSRAAAQKKELKLDNRDLHAWCEVYLDGIGWTPVEVTPGFYSQSIQADSVIDVDEAWSGGTSSDAVQAASVMGDVKRRTEENAERQTPLYITVLSAVAFTLVTVAALGLVVLLQRVVRRHHGRVLAESPDQNVCVPALYRYLTCVMRASGLAFDPTRPLDGLDGFERVFKGVDLREYRRIIELHQAFAFGGRTMKPNELRAVRRLTVRMHEALPEPVGIRATFKRYVIDVL